jgi:hypothetical protein
MKDEKKNDELSPEEIAFLKSEVQRVDALYGTAQVAAGFDPGGRAWTSLVEFKAGRVVCHRLADSLDDSLLADLRPVDPLVLELRARVSESPGE